jgi:hypothetical protein
VVGGSGTIIFDLKVPRHCPLVLLIRDSPSEKGPNLEYLVPVFVSLKYRVAPLYPRALGSLFVSSYDTQGYSGGILTLFHTGASYSGTLTGLPSDGSPL